MTLKFRYERKTVSRDLAAKLLKDLNHGNRKLHRPHVYGLAKDMGSGVFNLNPQPIVIREDAKRATLRLLDGQHRLHAAAEKAPIAGVSMMFCFVQGNDTEITVLQNTIDSGKARSTTDRGGFQGLGIPQGFLEKATRLFEIIGQAIDDKDPGKGVYGWMDAPKATYSACKLFAEGQSAELLRAEVLAAKHCKKQFKAHRITKQYLALGYLVAIMNGAEFYNLDKFAAEAENPKSALSCKLKEVWRDGHVFAEAFSGGSKNSSGIQYLLVRDLLVEYLGGTLKSDFQPVVNIREVDGTTLTDFEVA